MFCSSFGAAEKYQPFRQQIYIKYIIYARRFDEWCKNQKPLFGNIA